MCGGDEIMNTYGDEPKTTKVNGKVFVEVDKSTVRKGDVVDYNEQTTSKHRRTHFVERGLNKKGDIFVRLHSHEGTTRKVNIFEIMCCWRWRGALNDPPPEVVEEEAPIEAPVSGVALSPRQEKMMTLAANGGSMHDLTHGDKCILMKLERMGLVVVDKPNRCVTLANPTGE